MNKFFLLFFLILLGFLAKGQDDALCLSQPDKNLTAAQALVAQHPHLNLDDYNISISKTPEPKARKIRTRLRGITAFEIQPASSPEQSAVASHSLPVHLYVRNNALVCPFYYVFLFRLTPF
jgi:hypothetical protein